MLIDLEIRIMTNYCTNRILYSFNFYNIKFVDEMSKRQRMKNTSSRRIKTSHKKHTINRKIVYNNVDKTLKNINQIITKEMDKAYKAQK